MATESNLNSLHKKTAGLLARALTEIRQGRVNAALAMEDRFRVAEYLLTEAEEYISASWDLLRAKKPRASLATSRWVVEAALDILWGTAEPNEIEDRLILLAAEALRLEAARLEGLAKLDPNEAKQFKDGATAARQQMWNLVGTAKWRLDPLGKRMDSISARLKAKSVPNPYSLYRICCAAAHPGLELSRRFSQAAGGATVTRKPTDHMAIASRILAASTLWLVSAAYCLTEIVDAECLTRWWKDEIAPLLDR